MNREIEQFPRRFREEGRQATQDLRWALESRPQVLRAGAGSEVTMIASPQSVKTPDAALSASMVGPALRLIIAVSLCLFCLVTVCGAVIVK